MSAFPGIPGSPFMLDHLLGLLFIVHLICVNFVAMGPFVVAWYLLAKGERGRERARLTGSVLPVVYTFGITLGVAVLLFVQVLFPERFFTANILLGGMWLRVILLLVASFYGVYIVNALILRSRVMPWIAGLVSLGVGALIVMIEITMMSNYFVHSSAASWPAYQSNVADVFAQPTFIPRGLHFMFGSLGVTGFWLVWIATFRQRRGAASPDIEKLRRQGLTLAAAATSAQIVVGIWFVLAQPMDVWQRLFSGSFASIVWISGVAASLVMLVMLVIANFVPTQLRWQRIASLLLVWVMIGMISGREAVKLAAFGPDFNLRALPTAESFALDKLFFVLLLAAIVLLAFMLWLVLRPRRQISPSSEAEQA